MPSARTNEPNWTKIWTKTADSRRDERRGRHDVILAVLAELRRQKLPSLQLSLAEGAIGVGGWDGHGPGCRHAGGTPTLPTRPCCLEMRTRARSWVSARIHSLLIGEVVSEVAEECRRSVESC